MWYIWRRCSMLRYGRREKRKKPGQNRYWDIKETSLRQINRADVRENEHRHFTTEDKNLDKWCCSVSMGWHEDQRWMWVCVCIPLKLTSVCERVLACTCVCVSCLQPSRWSICFSPLLICWFKLLGLHLVDHLKRRSGLLGRKESLEHVLILSPDSLSPTSHALRAPAFYFISPLLLPSYGRKTFCQTSAFTGDFKVIFSIQTVCTVVLVANR